VLNDHDRVAAPAPRGNQLGDILLGMGIVAGSERWILKAALNVDHKQRTLPGHASDPTVGCGSWLVLAEPSVSQRRLGSVSE